MSAAEVHAAAIDAVVEQRSRIRARIRDVRSTGTESQHRAEADPQPRSTGPGPRTETEQDPERALLGCYLQPSDVLLDVGGGAGRLGLPLARDCQEVVNVEPSAQLRAAFTAAAAAASVSNVRAVPHDWLSAPSQLRGDVVLVAHVTYGVRNIVPFVDRLQTAGRRRVLILLYAAPAEAQPIYQQVHQLLFQETAAIPPSYRQLLPVLWDMRILPDVRVTAELGVRRRATTIDEAITRTLQSVGAILGVPGLDQDEWARRILRDHAHELYRPVDEGGYRPATDGDEDHRGVLITWEPHANRPAPPAAPQSNSGVPYGAVPRHESAPTVTG